MKVIDVIDKAKEKDVDGVTLNYDGDVVKFDDIWTFETEVYDYGIEDEEVSSYNFKNNHLYIKI